jgi:hypothetical protein
MKYAKGVVTASEKTRGREYTPKQRKFLTLLAKNDFQDIKQCLEDAGYAKNSWNILAELKEDIKEITESILIGHAPLAALTIGSVLSSEKPQPFAQNKITASREILDRVGIVKEERVKHAHEHTGGIFLIPAKAELPVEEDDYEDELVGEWEEVEDGDEES